MSLSQSFAEPKSPPVMAMRIEYPHEVGAGRDALASKADQTNASAPEQRDNDRRPYSGRVMCPELGNCEMAALDISSEGVGLLSPRPIVPGQRVTLYFLEGTMKVEGIVSRVRTIFSCDWQVGVSFLEQQSKLLQEINTVS